MSGIITCPYCKKEYDYDGEYYEEDRSFEEQCRYCEKYFMATIHYDISFESDKAPCLNGGYHKWGRWIVEIPPFNGKHMAESSRCRYCNKHKWKVIK